MNSAPLIATADLPIPAGGAAEWFEGEDGARLRAALYPPKGPPRGSVVLSPGRTEPIEKYHEVVGELQARGFVVLVHDWRGQGLSARWLADRRKGHATTVEKFRSDYSRLLAHFETRLPKPWVQIGHSMGGGLSLYMLARGETRFAVSALSSPMLGIPTPGYPPAVARILTFLAAHLGLANRYLFDDPSDPFGLTFETDQVTHDRARWDRFAELLAGAPDLVLGNLTWGWLRFALSLTDELARPGVLETIKIPVLIVAAGDDNRVAPSASALAARRIPKGKWVEIPTAWHEILMETDDVRAIWWREFDGLVAELA